MKAEAVEAVIRGLKRAGVSVATYLPDSLLKELYPALDADADIRNEKISYKVREHSVAKVPVLLAVGRREVDEKTVALRRLGSKHQTVVSLNEIVDALSNEILSRA